MIISFYIFLGISLIVIAHCLYRLGQLNVCKRVNNAIGLWIDGSDHSGNALCEKMFAVLRKVL